MVEVEAVSGGARLSEERPCQWQWENRLTKEKINRKKNQELERKKKLERKKEKQVFIIWASTHGEHGLASLESVDDVLGQRLEGVVDGLGDAATVFRGEILEDVPPARRVPW